jgi:hypothetical protein
MAQPCRAFDHAHNELVKTQKERKKSEIGCVPQDAAQLAREAHPIPEILPIAA